MDKENEMIWANSPNVTIRKKKKKPSTAIVQKTTPFAEFGCLIGMPIVSNLDGNYNREKLLSLIQLGNGITPRLYIQNNQNIDDRGIVQAIVNQLATVDEPEKMIGEVAIEFGISLFTWPQSEELTLKRNRSKVHFKLNEAATPLPYSGRHLAEYEMENKGCQYQVCIYYSSESHFNKMVHKFVYRRLP